MKAAGVSLTRIAALLGAERKTIRRWLQAARAPLWRRPRRSSLLEPDYDYLEGGWNEGCRNAAQLWRELVTRGFTGRPGTVRHWTGRRRKSEPRVASLPVTHGVPHQLPSVRQIARLLMTEDDAQPEAERRFVSRLLAQVPDLADCIAAAKRLNQVLRRHSQESLDEVLDTAAGTALKDFAVSLRRDQAAVQAALDLPWTTSPAEGQINRLKMVKRTMYGRAGFSLLRARVLHAA